MDCCVKNGHPSSEDVRFSFQIPLPESNAIEHIAAPDGAGFGAFSGPDTEIDLVVQGVGHEADEQVGGDLVVRDGVIRNGVAAFHAQAAVFGIDLGGSSEGIPKNPNGVVALGVGVALRAVRGGIEGACQGAVGGVQLHSVGTDNACVVRIQPLNRQHGHKGRLDGQRIVDPLYRLGKTKDVAVQGIGLVMEGQQHIRGIASVDFGALDENTDMESLLKRQITVRIMLISFCIIM